MSRYRQTFNEALQQVEKWSKDVEVKSTGEHAGKTIDQLKKEVDALRGKPNNEKEMGGLLFAIRAKQGWKKGEGSTGVEEGTEGDALVKAVANSPKQQALKKKQMLGITPAGKKALKKGDHKLSITPKGKAAVEEVEVVEFIATYQAAKRQQELKKKQAAAAKAKPAAPQGSSPSEEVEKEALDTWHPDPEKDRKSTSMKHTAKAVAHHDAQKKKPAMDTQQAAKKIQDILRKQRERKAAAAKNVKEDLEFKVKIKGIPSFYVPAKTAAAVKQSLRKQLKHPDDIESIVRVTAAAQKIDFRKRAQGKSDEDKK